MVYVTSDWHGVPLCEIKKLLDSAGFSDEDFLFVLGDVIDRGEHGVELLKWLMLRPNVQLILGNHEAMLLDCDFLFEEITEASLSALDTDKLSVLHVWQSNGGEATIAALAKESPETRRDILEYIREAPLYDSACVGDRDYVFTHGGLGNFSPERKIEDYTADELLWERPSTITHYSRDFVTIVGHTPTGYYGREYKGRILKTKTWWNIDTGAASGGMPMLLCLDDLKEYYLV